MVTSEFGTQLMRDIENEGKRCDIKNYIIILYK